MPFSLPYFDVRFVGAILVKARPKRNISATIVAYVKRFSHQINTDEVFGTHRPKIDRAMRDLIRRMSKENPKLGASRIHGELLMLGFEVAQSTVSKYMMRGGAPPSQTWENVSSKPRTGDRRH
jgi:hypothetical protein